MVTNFLAMRAGKVQDGMVDADQVTALRILLGSSTWLQRTRSFARALRGSAPRTSGGLLIVGTPEHLFVLSGTGDVIEPDEGIAAIGSGGPYAQAAADALLRNTAMSAEEIAREALRIAARICIYTNDDIVVETA